MSEAIAISHDDGSEQLARVLCVDDEPRVLEGLENHLAMIYDVHLAGGADEALEILASHGPFAVVISDMRMPQTSGAQLLALVKQRYPDTMRMLLTGHSDVESAVAAVNDGHICRYLTKPCPSTTLLEAVGDAVRQHELIHVEKRLLQETLHGAVEVLSHVMELAAPLAFSRSNSLADYVTHLCQKLEIGDAWEFEIAARLSQLGCIALPQELLEKARSGAELEDNEKKMFDDHSKVGGELVDGIPRLQQVAQIIQRQDTVRRRRSGRYRLDRDDRVGLGGALLAVSKAFDRYLVDGLAPAAAAEAIVAHDNMPESLARLLRDYQKGSADSSIQIRALADLRAGMILEEDVKTAAGQPVVRKGLTLNAAVLAKLQNFARGVGIEEPIRVRIPDGQ